MTFLNGVAQTLDSTVQAVFNFGDLVNYPIVFVHGIASSPERWSPTIETLVSQNYFVMGMLDNSHIYHNYKGIKPDRWVWSVTYYTPYSLFETFNGNLTVYSHRLDLMIEKICALAQTEKVVIISNSMGGLVSRCYMTLAPRTWSRVYRVLTIGTPHEGVITSLPFIGELSDLRPTSLFMQTLHQSWNNMPADRTKKWGVIGAIDVNLGYAMDSPFSTDSGGFGYVAIGSAIPYGEWQEAVSNNFGVVVYNTTHFGFRLAVNAKHRQLRTHISTYQGILWALSKE